MLGGNRKIKAYLDKKKKLCMKFSVIFIMICLFRTMCKKTADKLNEAQCSQYDFSFTSVFKKNIILHIIHNSTLLNCIAPILLILKLHSANTSCQYCIRSTSSCHVNTELELWNALKFEQAYVSCLSHWQAYKWKSME